MIPILLSIYQPDTHIACRALRAKGWCSKSEPTPPDDTKQSKSNQRSFRREIWALCLLMRFRFFNDILSEGKLPGFWHVMRSFYDGDTYAALPGNLGIVDQAVSQTVDG